jgi:acetyl-CoA synthetase
VVLGIELADRRMTTQAFVVLNSGEAEGEEMTATLQAFVKTRLLPFKYPRVVTYLEKLPKTGTDKVDRQGLKAMAQNVGGG